MNLFGYGTENKSKLINRRMFMLSSTKAVVFSGILGRLIYLQVIENNKYSSMSEKNRLREWRLPPQRGIIEDYFGTKIANNTQVYQLHLIPENVINYNELFFRLQKIIKMNDKGISKLKKKLKSNKPWEPIIVSDNLNWAEFSRLNLFLHEIPGIKPLVSVARKYQSDGSSSHILGYVSYISKNDLNESKFIKEVNVAGLRVGKTGLEKVLNESIIGLPGYERYEVNAYGKKIREVKYVEGKSGLNFKTTLDNEVQQFSAKILKEKNYSGSICVMDIYTGDIISMVSSPTFDANKFIHGISSKDWEALLKNPKKPLINKSLAGLYPPGSTIKPIVALSALENDITSPKFTVKCTGHIEMYGQKYHCWKRKGHGTVNLRRAIKESCDVYFYEIARKLGVDRLSKTAEKFGLGKKVLSNFKEEKNGLVPNTKWKLKNIGKGWVLGETLITGIGQGYFQCTPLQICLMTAQLANGGYKIKPRILDDKKKLKEVVESWKRLFSKKDDKKSFINLPFEKNLLESLFDNPENVKFVNEALYAATNEPGGTSYGSRYTSNKYMYAGKTGTSQVRKFTDKQRELKIKYTDLPYEERDHGLFSAYFPYKKPRYAISVLIEHGGSGSSVAAPVAKQVIKKVIDRNSLRATLREDIFQDI